MRDKRITILAVFTSLRSTVLIYDEKYIPEASCYVIFFIHRYFLSVRSKYSPQSAVLNHPETTVEITVT